MLTLSRGAGPLALLAGVLVLGSCSGRETRRLDTLGPSLPWLDLVAASEPHSPRPRLVAPIERLVVKRPGGDQGESTAATIRFLWRADLVVSPQDDAAFLTRLETAVMREVSARGGKIRGSGRLGNEGANLDYDTGDRPGSITIWRVQGTQATHLAIWVDEEI